MGVISDKILETGGIPNGVQKGCKVLLESGSGAEGSDFSNSCSCAYRLGAKWGR